MSIRNANRHRPVSGLTRAPWLTEAKLEILLGIESDASKSRRQLRLEKEDHNAAKEEAIRHMALGQLLLKQQEEKMISASRFQAVSRSLTSTASKVFAAVPIETPWSLSFIHSEMSRLGSSTRDVGIVQGCLNSLKDSGLVIEPSKGLFIRAPVKAEKPEVIKIPQPEPEKKAMAMPLPTPTPTAKTPISILSALATRCRTLADDLDTAALEIAESMDAQSADTQKLRQFQALLKSLNA